ncbi:MULTISPECIES: hypothetical protein [Methylobacterium]|uniref:Uncharacterized protein n=1 Tax=Methylobacterium longum TaxID=767694 RepID=A0ABT8AZ57_9HYPH|nr:MULTISPECIES: hypothetical protein [Methylobacterium]MCJ2099332.1 hypothetical protein [Methylobacterium sp. E-046]MDN3574711.1 hypothetical protein [Methylobacterium longum]GJE13163.1 hypothetical protein FOHLNKBM_4225 [Methylobacterium longum]
MNRSIPALLLTAVALAGLPAAAWAQEKTGAAPKSETAGKPAADTQEPGKTATDAVTSPSTVPPTEGAVGTGKPPAAAAPPAAGTPSGSNR